MPVCGLQLIPHLRFMPEQELRQKMEYIESVRSRFRFVTSFTEPPNAADTLMSTICQAQGKQLA